MSEKGRKGNVTATPSNSGADSKKHGTVKQTTARRDNSGSAVHGSGTGRTGSSSASGSSSSSGSRKKKTGSSGSSVGSLLTDALGSAVGGKKLSSSKKKKIRTILIVAAVLLVLAFFAPKLTGKSANLATLISEYLSSNNSDAAEVADVVGSLTGTGDGTSSDSLLSQVAGTLTGKSGEKAESDSKDTDTVEADDSQTGKSDTDDAQAGKTDEDKSDSADAQSDEGGSDSGAAEPVATAYKEYKFRNSSLLKQHYEKHGIEMGFESREAYEQAASDVINNPAALHKTEAEDGDYVYYIEKTNEFVILSDDGYIRTYFLPSAGIDYYNRQ